MKYTLAIALTTLLLGCSQPEVSTYQAPAVPDDALLRIPKVVSPLKAYGPVELPALLRELQRLELVNSFPSDPLKGEPLPCTEITRALDGIRHLEIQLSWVYDPFAKRFYRATATHSLDAPDSFGRPATTQRVSLDRRPAISVGFKFRRKNKNANLFFGRDTTATGSAGASYTETIFFGTLADGVPGIWQRGQEKEYFNQTVLPVSATGDSRSVTTDRQVVQAGLRFQAIAARLPGGNFRVDGALEISSFVDQGRNRELLSFPIELDGPRGMWVQTVSFRGLDASINATLRKLGIGGSASNDVTELFIKVD